MRYLVTGHTGFKGSWLSLWLEQLGHSVHGLALDPARDGLYERASVAEVMTSDTRGDIRDITLVKSVVNSVQPDVVIHMAAQPLVRESYRNPRWTLETNVMGTLNVLEAVHECDTVKANLIVTTDKVYRNVSQIAGYGESDSLGGEDPYSASKAMAELLTHSWVTSFSGPATATARAGNVIGGGDVSPERLMPDIITACEKGVSPVLRYPNAVRPWQHVLDCLNGYLMLVDRLLTLSPESSNQGSWNFGPDEKNFLSVGELTSLALQAWGSEHSWVQAADARYHEASLLTLDASKSKIELGWRERLPLLDAVEWTVEWHKAVSSGRSPKGITQDQIARFRNARQN